MKELELAVGTGTGPAPGVSRGFAVAGKTVLPARCHRAFLAGLRSGMLFVSPRSPK